MTLTPSQTVGPYFSIGLTWLRGPDAVPEDAPGAIRISGHVLDGAGAPVPDAMLETWQADGHFARSGTDEEGGWWVRTVKPEPVDGQAPHLDVSVFARGLLNRVVTRIYFADSDNAQDPVLETVEEARRGTLIARATDEGYRFDVVLQGAGETVFFAV